MWIWTWSEGAKMTFLPKPTFEVVEDPVEAAAIKEQLDRAQRNSDWLQAHWDELLPQARGKFVIVAGQEAFVADTPKDAWDWAARVHPEDNGAIGQYVRPEKGPRIYANRR